MSQSSQPGGLKRKRPDGEDEDEDPPSAPRRQHHFDVRQQILDLTYTKLERFRANPDSRLSRYVLILNTIRSLEQGMLKDGIKVGLSGSYVPSLNHQSPFDPNRHPPPDDTCANINSLEDAINSVNYSSNPYPMDTETRTATNSVINSSDAPTDMFGGVSSGATYSPEYDRYLMDLDSSSSGRATPFIKNDVEPGALWNEDSDRLTSLNWSSVLKMVDGGNPVAVNSHYPESSIESAVTNCNFNASSNSSSGCSSDCSMSDDAMSCSETSLHTLMPVTTGIPKCINTMSVCSTSSSSSSPKTTSASGSASSQSGSSPPSSEDEIFGDVDLALYDYDITPLSPPNVKMAPVSAEELMRSLSTDQKIDNLLHANSYYKKDFCSDDREHLTSVRT